MKLKYFFFIILVSILNVSGSCKENENITEVSVSEKPTLEETKFIQPFAGTDELGRTLPSYETIGNLKQKKQVGIFYFLWQGDNASKISEKYWDLSKIIPAHPEVLKDGDNPFWGSTSRGFFYFWGEPIYGYYRGDDYWVHLKNMQLLADANVDFLVIDATNTIIYPDQSEALMLAIKKLLSQGKKAPKLVYYTNTESGKTMQNIYNTFYKKGAPRYHPETWYNLEGKPLIIGRTKEAQGKDYENFFTFREAQWPNETVQKNGWPWIDFQRPQTVYINYKGQREIINVSVSQHPNHIAGMGGSAFYGNMDNWGRSYRNGSYGNPETDIVHGYNFQEQWDYALKQDVSFIFITGWNEWVAGRWGSTDDNPEHSYFCDQASPEYSRDIEPTFTAGIKDNYYMQMIANIRRYKGMNTLLEVSKEKIINNFNDWNDVKPLYIDYTDDTQHRNHPGAESNPPKTYINSTGKNDFYILKVARDSKNLYFYAETANNISSDKSNNWMNLYLNSDRKHTTGWYGYDYRIINGNQLQRYTNNKWESFKTIETKQEVKKIMYVFPAEYLSLNTSTLNFEFKWSDNMQTKDPMDWYVNGDVSPEGRFNYIYKTTK